MSDLDHDPFDENNQRAHIRANFSAAMNVPPAPITVTWTEDEQIRVNCDGLEDWVFEIPSDDDGRYYFRRGDIVLSFPYPEA